MPNEACDALECRLSFLEFSYGLSVRLSSCYDPQFSRVSVVREEDGSEISSTVVTESRNFTAQLPDISGSQLVFVFETGSGTISLQVIQGSEEAL